MRAALDEGARASNIGPGGIHSFGQEASTRRARRHPNVGPGGISGIRGISRTAASTVPVAAALAAAAAAVAMVEVEVPGAGERRQLPFTQVIPRTGVREQRSP